VRQQPLDVESVEVATQRRGRQAEIAQHEQLREAREPARTVSAVAPAGAIADQMNVGVENHEI
jgi:hypothetical protein